MSVIGQPIKLHLQQVGMKSWWSIYSDLRQDKPRLVSIFHNNTLYPQLLVQYHSFLLESVDNKPSLLPTSLLLTHFRENIELLTILSVVLILSQSTTQRGEDLMISMSV